MDHSKHPLSLKVAHQHEATISQRFSQYNGDSQLPPSRNIGGLGESAFEKLNDKENPKKNKNPT